MKVDISLTFCRITDKSENKRVIEHKHKLDIKLTIILTLFAIGIRANAFVPAFSIKDALADYMSLAGNLNVSVSGMLETE